MRKEQIAIIALAAWLTLLSVFMVLTQRVDLEVFFVFSLLGLLIIVELIGLTYIQPGYVRHFWYLLAAGIAIFGAIVVLKVMEIIGR